MKEAFTYMFKDPGYRKKAEVYFVFCFIALALMATPELANISSGVCPYAQSPIVTPTTSPILLFLPLIGMVFNFILSGYYFTCVQAITKQQNNIVLPFMNIWSSFVKGFKFFVAVILTSIVFGILYALCVFGGPIAIGVFSLILLLIFGLCGNAFMWLFSIEGKISTFFAWKKAACLVKQNAGIYFKNWFLSGLLIIVGAIVSTLFMFLFNYLLENAYIAWIATSIEGAVIASYTAFVGMYLIAKSIKPSDV